MITHADIMKMHEWVKTVKGRITFIFEGYRSRLVINKFIHAEDEEGKTIEWSRAFGSQLPHQVLSSFKIKIIIIKRGEEEHTLKSLKELFNFIS